MKTKVKRVNVLGPRLNYAVKRTFTAVTRKKGASINASSDCDNGDCSGGGADCANCGNCSNS